MVNGVKVIISSYDYIDPDAQRKIEYVETSPNGKFDLVAYRYLNDEHNLSFIHVSIIPSGGKIPKYGNYFIADMQSDYALNGSWDKDNSIIFYSKTVYADMIEYCLVHDRPKVQYKVVVDDEAYSGKYRWVGKSSR